MTKSLMRVLGVCLLLPGLYFMNVGSQQMADREAQLAERAATPLLPTGNDLMDIKQKLDRDTVNFQDGNAHANAYGTRAVGQGLLLGGLVLLGASFFGGTRRRLA